MGVNDASTGDAQVPLLRGRTLLDAAGGGYGDVAGPGYGGGDGAPPDDVDVPDAVDASAPADEQYVVAQCFPGGLVLRSTVPSAALPAVGQFVWDPTAVPADDADLCFDCSQYGSVITAVGAPSDCAAGAAECVEIEVQTRPALVSELPLPAALLAELDLAQFADVTFFEALGCSDATGATRRLSGACLPPAPHTSPSCSAAASCLLKPRMRCQCVPN